LSLLRYGSHLRKVRLVAYTHRSGLVKDVREPPLKKFASLVAARELRRPSSHRSRNARPGACQQHTRQRAYTTEAGGRRWELGFSAFSALKTENRPSLSGRFSCPAVGRARRQASASILSPPGSLWAAIRGFDGSASSVPVSAAIKLCTSRGASLPLGLGSFPYGSSGAKALPPRGGSGSAPPISPSDPRLPHRVICRPRGGGASRQGPRDWGSGRRTDDCAPG